MSISYLITAVCSFAVTVKKCANCKLCGHPWPHSDNIHTNALYRQAAHFMHIGEKHACVMNIDHILNRRRIDDGNFAATVTKMCKLQIVWTFFAS